ncbi:helix-turn-helix domain-containing protein [Acidianus sp. HS-5]|uniref:helix-turn-helix transcriptional regulator n=1 Tax=Acidianus sp. HS-5 TaxID=2886040 RepID=UPI001F0158FF|nr:helix-turn-helix domain-containing protein [Acidianus sp. HS-5]
MNWILIAFDVSLGIIAFFVTKDLLDRRNKKVQTDVVVTEGLSERDTKVLDAIKQGAKNLSEVVKVTGLPKSTAYRAVQKLMKEGYIALRKENGEYVYSVKEDSK